MQTNNRLRIAIQKKGRLYEPSMEFLASLGLELSPKSEIALVQKCPNFDLDVVFVRDDDIPWLIERGIADFGIVGKNVLLEADTKAQTVMPLMFGICRLVIAVPEISDIKELSDLEGERIATTYPRILREYLRSKNINAAIIPITGSVEIAPELNLADAICDIVQSGSTLKAHQLIPIATIMESSAVIISSPFQTENKKKIFELIKRKDV
jgi:ATP phosphoribosyltransferase